MSDHKWTEIDVEMTETDYDYNNKQLNSKKLKAKLYTCSKCGTQYSEASGYTSDYGKFARSKTCEEMLVRNVIDS